MRWCARATAQGPWPIWVLANGALHEGPGQFGLGPNWALVVDFPTQGPPEGSKLEAYGSIADPFGSSLGPSQSGIIVSGEPLLAWDNYFSGMFVLLGFYQWDNFLP